MLFRQGYTKGGWIHFAVNHEMQTMTSIEINFFFKFIFLVIYLHSFFSHFTNVFIK